MKSFISLTLGIAMIAGCATVPETRTNKDLAVAAATETIAALDAEKVDAYFADPYIQHNPAAASGVEGLKALIAGLSQAVAGDKTAVNVEVFRVIEDGDLVAMHNIWTGFGPAPLVGFDVFRFNEEGRIVEHWDNLAPLADKPNPSGRTQLDGATEIVDLAKTEANRALVLEFIDRALIKGEQFDYTQYINPEKYLQHNTDVADGLDGFGAWFQELSAQGIEMRYTKIGLVVAEGNFVLTGSEGVFGGKLTAFYDLFRLEDGKIVEHWDVISEIQTENLPDGYPGKF